MSFPHARTAVERMHGYTPGEQPAPGERVIKLNTNENPFPPSPRVLEAIRGIDPEALRRYPQPLADGFRTVAARVHGVATDAVLAGNGSDDILQIVLRTFCGPGDVLAAPDPTYSLYPVLAALADVTMVTVPWEPDWRLPTKALLEAKPRAIFFANPNSPSGTLVDPSDVEALARQTDAVVLVDEAYTDFADRDCLHLLARHGNVVIARTLSKGYALAGLRFGYALAAPALVAQMVKVKDSYNCDAIAIAAACAALEDVEYAQRGWTLIRQERTRLTRELSARGFSVVPSEANFLLATVPAGGEASRLYHALRQQGILIRYFDKPGLDDKLRISVGTVEQNNALLSGLDRALGR